MHDERKWRLAVSQFRALRNNRPNYIGEDLVREFHVILDQMTEASGEDLTAFRIPASEVKPRIVSVQMGGYRRPGRAHYSKDNFCDNNLFDRKIEALFNYLPEIELSSSTAKSSPAPNDYDLMTSDQLEVLAHKYNIDGYGDQQGHVNRSVIISRLRARDRALNSEKPSVHNTINVENMNGSVIQQGTSNSRATVHSHAADLQALVDKIRKEIQALPIEQAAKYDAEVELRTIEPQLTSTHPKKAIIASCLLTLRTMIIGAAKTAATAELSTQIEHALKSLGF